MLGYFTNEVIGVNGINSNTLLFDHSHLATLVFNFLLLFGSY